MAIARAPRCDAGNNFGNFGSKRVTAVLQRKETPARSCAEVELEEKNLQTKRKRPAEVPACSRVTLR
jgi:hypothetical protein